jgi:hypothetical protein
MKQALRDRGLLVRIALPPVVDAFLTALQPEGPVPDGADVRGMVQLGVNEQALGFLSLNLTPPGPSVPYHLVTDEAAGSFSLWLILSDAPPAKRLFSIATGAAGVVLKPATLQNGGGQEWLEEAAGAVAIAGAEVALLVEGRAGGTAALRLTPTDGQPDGLIQLGLDPPTVLLGSSGFGLELSDGFWIDESTSMAPPGQTIIDGRPAVPPPASDDATWRGLAARKSRFFIPRGVPLFGGHAVDAYVEVGSEPRGIDAAIATRWTPPDDGSFGFDVLIECRDPAATGLQDFVPTVVEAAMTLPLEEATPALDGAGFTVLAGKPVVARLRFVRSSTDPETHVTLALESQGPDGIVTIKAPEGGPAARGFITAGALATALVADQPPADADATGVGLHALLVAALALSTFIKDQGRLTLNSAVLASEGHGVPLGGVVKLTLDYSVDVLVKPISIGVLSVRMSDEQPMRVRNRNVGLTIDPSKSGLDMLRLDFSRADMEIEDPGAWLVDSPGSLFDILGTRSGRGSMWLEVDLQFKLNLGPVKISGATIRAVREDDGTFSATIRGLDASVEVPGAISGGGRLQLLDGGGFAAELDANLVPLNLAAGATVLYEPHGDSFLLFLRLGVDLPGPIPVANTGLGIFGVAGSFGINARPEIPPSPDGDQIGAQLKWDSSDPTRAFGFSHGNLTIGVEAVVGTVPDLGFSFSAKGGIFLTIPDLAIRGALWGTVLSPRLKVTDRPSGPDMGLAFRGVVVVDAADGVTIGLKGTLRVPVLIEVVVPLGAHFPFSGSPVDPDDWFIYLGADGYVNSSRPDGRGMGPIRATVLPDLMPTSAEAYLMQRGKGIDRWPRGQAGAITISDGFVLTFGFAFEDSIGIRPIAWADIHASLDVLLATRPLTLAGFGDVGGSLNLGPFSIGVEADISFLVAENADPYIHARVCGRIDLFFTDIEGCAQISIHSEPKPNVPQPDVHPLDDVQNGAVVGDLAFLIDDRYTRIGNLTRQPTDASVWPDTLLHLPFAISPKLAPGYASGQFAGIDSYPSGLAAEPLGSSMLRYEWTLNSLRLVDVTSDPAGPGTPVAGPLSAAWQLGKDGDMGVRPQAGDLVLLTYQGDLWLNRLADGGQGLDHNPMEESARFCLGESSGQLGWAVGHGVSTAQSRLVLPSDPLSPDTTVSRFTAQLTLRCSILGGAVLSPTTASTLPWPYTYSPPRSISESTALELPERSFLGEVDIGSVGGATGIREPGFNIAELVPSTPLEQAQLLLFFTEGEDVDAVRILVSDDGGETWQADAEGLPDGRTLMRFRPANEVEIKSIELRWGPGARVAILGLGGVTSAARDAARQRNDARQAAASRQAEAAATQPQQPDTTVGAGARCLLEPGKLYRLDVDLSWSGWLYEQQDDGSVKEVANSLDQRKYMPKGGAETDTTRSYFFRTTPKPSVAPVLLPTYGDKLYLSVLHRRQDRFDPQMLARLLAGYTPAQSERDRFRHDPLQVHFSAAHAAVLAKAYGYELKIGLRRVDAPGQDGEEQTLDGLWLAIAASAQLGLVDTLRLNLALAAACPVPKPGATLQADAELAPEAWYEVFTLVRAIDADLLDGRLAGTTFRTSRWRTPDEMVGALGFTTAPSAATGDLEVRMVPALATALADDLRLEAALDALGLDGWPPADVPRTSLLWHADGGGGATPWHFAGVLVESPEPIDRPGRCEVLGLGVQPEGGATPIDLRRSDRNRSRLLFLAQQPFVPSPGSTLALTLADKSTGAAVSGAISLPPQPGFAEL